VPENGLFPAVADVVESVSGTEAGFVMLHLTKTGSKVISKLMEAD